MWHVCFAVFVIPTAIFAALALVEPLIYGGEQQACMLITNPYVPVGQRDSDPSQWFLVVLFY